MLNNFFKIKQNGSTVRTEIVAGLTTFFTMVYIVVVNPAILSSDGVGVPFDQVFMATIFAAVTGTLIMGLAAKYPIAIAPGMGLNAYFATIVASQGISYQTVFAAVFVAGILFFLLSVSKLREMLLHAIPDTIKYGISSGIGLFIAFLGLKNAGIIEATGESTLIGLGDLSDPVTLLSIVGLIITLILMVRHVKGALFIGMIITAVIGYFCGMLNFDGVVSAPPALVFFDLDFGGVFTNGLYAVIFSFLLVTIFDTTGTMMAVSDQAGLVKNGKFPRAKQAFIGDSLATIVGAAFGTSPSTAYVESSTGVAAGGRTGLTAVVVAIMFLLTMFFSPIIAAISSLASITAPVLIIVGCFMMEGLAKIKWSSFEDAFTAFIIILIMPLAGSISTGIAFGFIIYPLLKLVSGKGKEVHPLIYVFAVLFLIQMIFFPAH